MLTKTFIKGFLSALDWIQQWEGECFKEVKTWKLSKLKQWNFYISLWKLVFFPISRGTFWSICAKRAINGQQLNCHWPEKEIVNENPSRNKSQDNFSRRKMSVHYFYNIVSTFLAIFLFNLFDIITVEVDIQWGLNDIGSVWAHIIDGCIHYIYQGTFIIN